VTATLASLIQTKTQQQLVDEFLGALAAAQFPVTDWNVGAVGRCLVEMLSAGTLELSNLVGKIAAGGYAGLAEGDWLDLLAEQTFATSRAQASACVQQVRITAGSSQCRIAVGTTVRAPSGRLYRWTETDQAVIAPGNWVDYYFAAVEAGSAYNSDTVVVATPVVIVSGITNGTAQLYPFTFAGDAAHGYRNPTNTSYTYIAPAVYNGNPTKSWRYRVTIIATGKAGVSGSCRVDFWDDNGVLSSLGCAPIPNLSTGTHGPFVGTTGTESNLKIGFNDYTGSYDFILGETFDFAVPGSSVVTPGTDSESDEALSARLLAKWPSLAAVPTEDKYAAMVREVSTEEWYGISQIAVSPSGTIPGKVDIIVAGYGAVPDAGTIADVQAFVDQRLGVCERAEVIAATTKGISAMGTVQVRASDLVATKAAAEAAWDAYLLGLPIGGDVSTGYPGVVRLSELSRVLMEAGARDVSGLLLELAAANVSLTASQVATKTSTLAATLYWVTVA
jgi:hypothetical protein